MSKVNIHIEDATGRPYAGDEVVVLIPGKCTAKTTDKADINGCVYIPAGKQISEYLTTVSGDDSYTYAENLLSHGFDVLYQTGITNTTKLSELFEETYLLDKNAYNIKFLTSGCLGSIDISNETVDSSIANKMLAVAANRKDCVALIDYVKLTSTTTIQEVLEAIQGITDQEGYGAMFADWGTFGDKVMPGSFFYLLEAGNCIEADKKWDSVAGVKRGVTSNYGGPNKVSISKYDLDNTVMELTDDGIRSFNGIVKVRPYGYTIWGDRTLRKNSKGEGLKAMSFLSLRLLVCDLCKRVYDASINNTFESNNDVTWMNYKSYISEILDKMVADGKLADYKINKLPSDKSAQIKSRIRLVPNEPVEDFDIYIKLENNDAEITEG